MSSAHDAQIDGRVMNAHTDIATAQRFAGVVEEAEARRLGITINSARSRIAQRLGVAPGTLENIRRLRSKVIPNWLMARIRAEFILVLQREIGRLEHEITLARQTGADNRDDDFSAAEAQLVEAKKILNGTS